MAKGAKNWLTVLKIVKETCILPVANLSLSIARDLSKINSCHWLIVETYSTDYKEIGAKNTATVPGPIDYHIRASVPALVSTFGIAP